MRLLKFNFPSQSWHSIIKVVKWVEKAFSSHRRRPFLSIIICCLLHKASANGYRIALNAALHLLKMESKQIGKLKMDFLDDYVRTWSSFHTWDVSRWTTEDCGGCGVKRSLVRLCERRVVKVLRVWKLYRDSWSVLNAAEHFRRWLQADGRFAITLEGWRVHREGMSKSIYSIKVLFTSVWEEKRVNAI